MIRLDKLISVYTLVLCRFKDLFYLIAPTFIMRDIFCNSCFLQQDWAAPVSQDLIASSNMAARSNWQLVRYLWLFSWLVFNSVSCPSAVQDNRSSVVVPVQLFIDAAVVFCVGSVTGNCFHCNICSLVLCIFKELQQILQCVPASDLLLLYCRRGCFYLFQFCFYYGSLLDQTWNISVEFMVHNLFATDHFFQT